MATTPDEKLAGVRVREAVKAEAAKLVQGLSVSRVLIAASVALAIGVDRASTAVAVGALVYVATGRK